MSPQEAKKILLSLARGEYPDTGEALPDPAAFKEPRLLRALYVAIEALNEAEKVPPQSMKQKLQKFSSTPNAGKSWTMIQDHELLNAFDDGVLIQDIAIQHGRTDGAIASRLVLLGRIDDRDEVLAPCGSQSRQEAAGNA